MDAATTQTDSLGIVKQFLIDVWNNRDIELARQLVSPEYRVNFYGLPEKGYEDYLSYFPQQLQTWSDLHVTMEHIFADGDWVSARYSWTGTHSQTAYGVPASGRVIKGGGIGQYRVKDGKVVEAWVCEDMLSILRQMGAIPDPD